MPAPSRSKPNARQRHHRRGMRAEALAALLLQCKAYRILARRYKTPVGEIDLIARRGGILVFVEVKGRADEAACAEAIHGKNRQRVVRASQYYLAAHPELAHLAVRFDALLVPWYRWPKHLIAAFDAA